MKTIFNNWINEKQIWKVTLILLIAVTILSCSKEDNPEIEASLQAANSQELILGKWNVSLAQSSIAGHCLDQYYLDFDSSEVKDIGSLALIDDQPVLLDASTLLSKICESPDETTHAYSWVDDKDFTILIDSKTVSISIISVSDKHLIIQNKATDKMMVLKRGT